MAGIDAGSIFSEIRINLGALRRDLQQVNTRFTGFARNNQRTVRGISGRWTNLFSGINLGGIAAATSVAAAFAAATKTFAETEQSLANVQAVTNATAAEFAQLEQAAQEAGATTRFSASESADALFFLASAGFDATQSIEALDGVLLLAGATGSDLSQTAQTVTAAISQFGLEADQSARVANVFAAANSNSQATLSRLQNALRQAGAISGQFDISLEETVGSLQALFNAGLEGEQAGTAVRNLLLDLSDSSSTAAQSLVAAGLSFDSFNPRVVGLTGAIETLANSGADLSAVFGRETVGAALILSDAANDADQNLRQLTEAVTDTDEAARQYAVQNDTLAGSFDRIRSQLEAFGNSIIRLLTPALRGILSIGGAVLNFFTGLFTGIQTVLDLSEAQAELNRQIESFDIDDLVNEYFDLQENESLSADQKVRLVELNDQLLERIPGLTEDILDNRDATLELANAERILAGQRVAEQIEVLTVRQNELREALQGQTDIIRNQLIDSFRSIASVSLDILESQGGAARAVREFSERVNEATTSQQLLALAQEAGLSGLNDLNPAYARDSMELMELSEAILEARQRYEQLQIELGNTESSYDRANRVYRENVEEQQRLNEENNETIELTEEEIAALDRLEEERQRQLALAEEQREIDAINAEFDRRQRNELEELTRRVLESQEESLLIAEREAAQRENNEEVLRRQRAAHEEYLESLRLEQEELARIDEEVAARNLDYEEQNRLQQLFRDTREELGEQISRLFLSEEQLARGRFRALGFTEDQIEALVDLIRQRRELEEQLEEEAEAQRELERATEEAAEAREDSIEAYEDLLDDLVEAEEEATEAIQRQNSRRIRNYRNAIQETLSLAREIANELFGITEDRINREIEEERRLLDTRLQLLDEELEARLQAEGVAELSRTERLQRQLDEAIEAGDEEEAEELRTQLRRAQIEEEFAERRNTLLQENARRVAELEYQQALNRFEQQRLDIIASFIAAGAQAFAQFGFPAGLIPAAALAVIAGVQLSRLEQARPQPPQFQTGGVVLGAGSSQGRIVSVAENGTNELLLNDGNTGQEVLQNFANLISQAMDTQRPVQLILNGRIIAEDTIGFMNRNEIRVD